MNTPKKLQKRSKQKALRLIAFLSFFAATFLNAQTPVTLTTTYSSETTEKNRLEENLFIPLRAFTLDFIPMLGIGASIADLETLRMGLGIKTPEVLFLRFGLRLSQNYLLPETVSQSDFLLSVRAKSPAFIGVSLFAGAGWYKRYVLLRRVSIPAVPVRSSYSEHDFAFELGLNIFESSATFIQIKAATFNAVEVFNLNNPFGEIELGHRFSESLTLSIFSRYQILLGFGRLDRFSMGFNAHFGNDALFNSL